MQKKYRCLSIFTYSFILLTSSMSIIGMGPVANNSLNATQHTIYSLSQQNQTEFANYSTQNTGTNWYTLIPYIMIDVVDQDGVVMVWFSSRQSNESQWSNHSMQRSALRENTFRGSFRVTVSMHITEFDIKFYANDSLGHVSESELYELRILYDPGNPTAEYEPFLPIIAAIFIIIVFAAVLIILKLKDRKQG